MVNKYPGLKLWQIILFYLMGLGAIGYGLVYKDITVSILGGIIILITSAAILYK